METRSASVKTTPTSTSNPSLLGGTRTPRIKPKTNPKMAPHWNKEIAKTASYIESPGGWVTRKKRSTAASPPETVVKTVSAATLIQRAQLIFTALKLQRLWMPERPAEFRRNKSSSNHGLILRTTPSRGRALRRRGNHGQGCPCHASPQRKTGVPIRRTPVDRLKKPRNYLASAAAFLVVVFLVAWPVMLRIISI